VTGEFFSGVHRLGKIDGFADEIFEFPDEKSVFDVSYVRGEPGALLD
jgi:hypothetical protein